MDNLPIIGATILFLLLAFYTVMAKSSKFNVHNRNVIVTGGSQGMGLSVAKILSSRGAHVAIIARNQQKLDAAIAEIQSFARDTTKQRFAAVSADLSNAEQASRAIVDAESQLQGPVDVLWCCAGSSTPSLFLDSTPAIIEQMVGVNYFSAAYAAHAGLKSMVSRISAPEPSPPPTGLKIIFSSSLAALAPVIGYSTYTSAKAAIRALADSLRQEVLIYAEPSVISVHCCMLGTILTPGLEQENVTKHEITKIVEGIVEEETAEQVAVACIKGLERGDTLITTNFTGESARAGMQGITPLNGVLGTIWGVLLTWIATVAWLFIRPDMDSKVRKYRKEKGVPKHDILKQ